MSVRALAIAAILGLAAISATPAPGRAQEGTVVLETTTPDFNVLFRARTNEALPTDRGLTGSTLTTGGYVHHRPTATHPTQFGGVGYGMILFRDPIWQNRNPGCADEAQLATLSRAFAEKESRFWNSNLTIVRYAEIRRVAENPWGQNNIPRRYCTAKATLSDGRTRVVDYAIIEDHRIIGSGPSVEWCVNGLDRGRSFDPSCRMARP